MKTADEALDLIAAKIPELSTAAAKIKARASVTLKLKATNRLIGSALAHPDAWTDTEREQLAAMVQAVKDNTKSAHLPPVRVRADQLEQLEADAEREGLTLSALILRRVFGPESPPKKRRTRAERSEPA